MGGGFYPGGAESAGRFRFCVAHGAVPHVLSGHGALRPRAAVYGAQRNGLGELDGGDSPSRGQRAARPPHVPAAKIFPERGLVPFDAVFWPRVVISYMMSQ